MTTAIRRAARRLLRQPAPPPAVHWTPLGSPADQRRYDTSSAREMRHRRAVERAYCTGGEAFTVPGRCWVCRQSVDFTVDYAYSYPVDGTLTPNWREHLRCPACGLKNRMRAAVHFLEEQLAPCREALLYAMEQTTPLFRCLSERYPNTIGSEYLGRDALPGEAANGIRNESATRLSFAADSFDLVLSFEVLEHVPDFRRALAECHRVLRPGGSLLFSAPFRPEHEENLVRARIDDQGAIRHLLPPEYHGDPLSQAGCLAFYCFGWELLDQARAAGFSEARGYAFWSRDFGYLGSNLILFLATKGPA